MIPNGSAAFADRGASDGVGAYRAAVDCTTRTIERRATYYRNQVIVVVLIAAAALTSSLAARSPAPLAALLLLVPACAFFLVADARLVNDWRSEIVARWTRRGLDLAAFRSATRAHPALPKDTTEAMLAMLPAAGDLPTEQRILTPTRLAVASATRAVYDRRADTLLLNAAASAVAATAIAAALWTGTATPLLALATIVLRPVLGASMERRRRSAREAEVEACRRHPEFDEAEYRRLLVSL